MRAAAERSQPPRLRSDAMRNRQLILEAAAQAFAEHGLNVGYDEIARLAGVGVGTVYRRFPDRAELIAALFDSRIDQVLDIAAQSGLASTGWNALRGFIESVVALQAADRGMQQVLWDGPFDHERLDRIETVLVPAAQTLLSRAQAEGSVRGDLEVSDIRVLMKLVSSLQSATHPNLWQRYFAIFIDGLAATRQQPSTLPGSAPTHAELRALRTLFC